MKIAHLILAHTDAPHLQRLVSHLLHADAHIYIHIDKKADVKPFESLASLPGVSLLSNRVNVRWGGYSMVEATVQGFRAILKSGVSYEYVNLLSGADYPLKPAADIHAFLAGNPGKVFMQTYRVMDEWSEAIPRITDYHLTNYRFPGSFKVERMLTRLLPNRKLPNGMTPVGRSQWFTASLASVAYMVRFLDDNRSYVRFFKLSWAPDELIFQTILYNSPFCDKMVNDNLRYIDWSGGGANPKSLTMDDAGALNTCDKLFARKFNSATGDKILSHIDKTLLAK